ncbi:hypothetical protein FV222_06805 [Methylobacterium sp. WL103]|uniref:hypothetical protein n=1 Tax=Methylobacterium sp. WL103 TaxID=2603891 RepID=UPI0011CB2234|nr:hypothetical protein [Methylobacterium sp. WL103]TXN05320.1 hypothetical protein FV222_06805 [Methylobacterium sp. WL103]
MGDASHYSSFAADPVPGSAYDFYVAATRIRDEEPAVPLGLAPVSIRTDMDLCTRRFWERRNPFLEEVAHATRRQVIEELCEAGMLPDCPAEPLSPELEAYVSRQVRRIHYGYLRSEEELQGKAAAWKRTLSPEKRVLIGARLCSGSSDKAAQRLNEGIQPGGPKRGLGRHHVYRAMHAFLRLPDFSDFAIRAEILLFVDNFRTLRRVRTRARAHRSFRGLDGRELAEAIHERSDLWHVCDRTRDELPPLPVLLAA